MINVYPSHEGRLSRVDAIDAGVVPERALWFDLVSPSREQEQAIEAIVGIEIPTREEMREIEASSRLYREGETLYMTVPVIVNSASAHPETSPITFVLFDDRLITVRYSDPHPFKSVTGWLSRHPGELRSGVSLLLALLDAIVDRLADIIERASEEVDALSREAFLRGGEVRARRPDFEKILVRLGQGNELASRIRESLGSLSRLFSFLAAVSRGRPARDAQRRLKSLNRDVDSLSDHTSFLSSELGFLLNATLGMINIEQNAIIKIFSVAAVVFLPPTLIASIYGMNFRYMPELDWLLGYPLAVLLMIASAVLPYLYFKRRRWL